MNCLGCHAPGAVRFAVVGPRHVKCWARLQQGKVIVGGRVIDHFPNPSLDPLSIAVRVEDIDATANVFQASFSVSELSVLPLPAFPGIRST